MGSDLDRRCANQERELEDLIFKCEKILGARRRRGVTASSSNRLARVRALRDENVVALHDMRRAHNAYDARYAAALDDPTGQDLDSFHDRYGEGDEPRRMEY